MLKSLIGPVLLAITLAACGATTPKVESSPSTAPTAPPGPHYMVGEHVTLTGQLIIKGSMPMLQAVLIRESGERWELKGVQPMEAARWQNKPVTVDGKVERNVGTPMLYPSLTVTTIALVVRP